MIPATSSLRIGAFARRWRPARGRARGRLSEGLVWRPLVSQYLLPIGLLLAFGLGGLFAVLFHLTALQDQVERQREIGLVANSLESNATATANNLSDYAFWDEAVRNIVIDQRPEWVENNIDSYGLQAQGYRWISIVDATDRPLFPRQGLMTPSGDRDPAAVLGPAYVRHRQALRDAGRDRNTVINGYSRSGYGVFTYVAAYILPATEALPPDAGRGYVMTVAARIDAVFLRRLAERHHLKAIRLTTDPPDAQAAALKLADTAGNPVAWIAWTPQRPGSTLRWQVLPAFILVGIVCVFAAALILQRAHDGLDALRTSEARAQHLARHDMLTGLPNRRAMIDDLRDRLARATTTTLLYMDLDGFKDVNDVYGHALGDEVLREASARIRRMAGSRGAVARIGGDEFAVLLTEAEMTETVVIADAVLAAIQDPIEVNGFRLRIGTSIGIADNAGLAGIEDPEAEIVRRADVAMYAAKANGKNRWHRYDPAADRLRAERKWLEQDLRLAIDQRALTVAFQPVVDARSRAVTGVEALARWTRDGEEIAPELFISVAEESGLIVDLGRQLLTDACRHARSWGICLSANISPTQFWDRNLAASVAAALDLTGFPAARLELELNESYLLRRPRAARQIIEELRAIGVRIALDEFGRSFGSIGFLRELPVDRIKIDRSLVRDVARDADAAEIARSVVAIGRSLGLPVTAEGIEGESQATIMRAAGCDRLQGWLFGRPADPATVGGMLG